MSSSNYSINLLGSAIDVSSIVENLMYLERAPVRDMESKISSLEEKVSAYQSLNTKLSALSDKLNSILFADGDVPLAPQYTYSERLAESIFAKCTMVSSDEDIVSATASAAAGGGTYSITVGSLAQAQTSVSSSFADATSTSLGTGTITISKAGGDPVSITINSSNSTLSGLRDAINNSQAGVTATIINDGSSTPYRLMITANDTGSANSFALTSSLSGGEAISFSQTQGAADAQFTVNGVSLTKSSNTISDVINGVTFTLRNVSTGPISIHAERDVDSIVGALEEFVTAYNAVSSFINSQFSYSADSGSAGVLAGDSTLRRVQSMLQNPLVQSAKNQYTNFSVASQVGLEFNRDGSLTLNEAEFRQEFENNFTAVAALFLGNGTPAGGVTVSDSRVSYSGKTAVTQAGTYAIQIDALAQQASAIANQSITSLLQDETLTINYGTATAVVYLLQNDSLTTILSKISNELNAQGIAVVAKDDGAGKINLSTNSYGSSEILSIVSNRDDIAGSTGFGTIPVVVSGTDIAGTINGHAALGNGLTLTGAGGQPEEGLSVSISQTTAGNYGSVTVASETEGVTGTSILMSLFNALDGLTDSLSSPIAHATDGLNKNIVSLNDQIAAYELRLAKREEYLTAQFDAADQALRLLTVAQSSLAGQINSLSSNSK
jgi:flagellar hook-associated protein 2